MWVTVVWLVQAWIPKSREIYVRPVNKRRRCSTVYCICFMSVVMVNATFFLIFLPLSHQLFDTLLLSRNKCISLATSTCCAERSQLCIPIFSKHMTWMKRFDSCEILARHHHLRETWSRLAANAVMASFYSLRQGGGVTRLQWATAACLSAVC